MPTPNIKNPAFVVVRSTGKADVPFSATFAEGADEQAAADSLGGHYVHVFKDDGGESIVYESEPGVKHALLVEGRPQAQPEPAKVDA